MHPVKAPSPNGLSVLFYQKYWKLIGEGVTGTVLDFLNNGRFDPNLNYTHIVLISKIKKPESMSQFRPISLYNVIYKLIAKVLANRLKVILDKVIFVSQSAFVPGRLITDNAIASFELNHYLKRKARRKIGYFVFKLDMKKAYDRV